MTRTLMSNDLPWIHDIASLNAGARRFDRHANDQERRKIAEALDLASFDVLHTDYKLEPQSSGLIALTGRLTAKGFQRCVISGEPVPFALAEAFEVAFGELIEPEAAMGEEREVSSLRDVEPIEQGALNFGRVVFDLLAVGLDPYPRADSAAFEPADARDEGDVEENKPFAALAKWKRPT